MRTFLCLAILLTLGLATLGLQAIQQASAAPAIVTLSVASRLDDIDDNPGNGFCHTSPTGPAAGLCTLRAAVMEASHTSGPGVVINLPSGIYTLTISATSAPGETNGDLDLITPTVGSPLISIVGAGAASTIIDAGQLDRVLYVHTGRQAAISGLTLRNGYFPSGSGGGLYNEGTLTITDSLFSLNHAYYGGGGLFNQGTLTVTNSLFSQNSAFYGGGLYNLGTLNLNQSTLSQNSASSNGGGVHNSGTLSVNQSTLNQNDAYSGGGVYNFGTLIMNRSTISGNTASVSGAGIYNYQDLFLSNSTLSSNSTNGNGGGIYNFDATLNVYNTTIFFNEADADADGGNGGGVYNFNTASSIFNMRNTLLASNYLSGAPIYDECSGQLRSYGNNLIGLAGEGGLCSISQYDSGSWTTLNSQYLIGPLQNNGGPTWTHALLRGSNAIDGGDPTLGCVDFNGALLTDQRGEARVIGVRCDIGAFEYRPPPLYLPFIRR